MITAGRPTLRCLRDDLPNDWEDVTHRAEAAAGANGEMPLTDLRHPIIRKAADDFPETPAEGQVLRESISGLSNPVWWKVKIGARWRGAVWEDPATGQAWLCAAGYRREGEDTDFYKQFMADVAAKGPDFFRPDAADRDRLEREKRARRLDVWSAGIQRRTRAEVLSVWDGGQVGWDVCHPSDTARVLATVEVTTESVEVDDELALEVTVSIACKDYAAYPLVQWIEMVILMTIDPREQQWASLDVSGVPVHSQIVEGEGVADLRRRVEESRPPGEVEQGGVAHYSHKARLVESMVEGEGIKSLCGSWFVPRQDHEALDKCPACHAIYQALPDDEESE